MVCGFIGLGVMGEPIYALDLAREVGIDLAAAGVADAHLRDAIAAGDGDLHWPVVSRIIGR